VASQKPTITRALVREYALHNLAFAVGLRRDATTIAAGRPTKTMKAPR
jgi:hypothetical protein